MTSVTAPPSAAELADPATARLWKAAQDFEAMALGELLKPMFETTEFPDNPFGGGDGESAWRPMLTQEYAKLMERRGGVGLAVPVYQALLRAQAGGDGKS